MRKKLLYGAGITIIVLSLLVNGIFAWRFQQITFQERGAKMVMQTMNQQTGTALLTAIQQQGANAAVSAIVQEIGKKGQVQLPDGNGGQLVLVIKQAGETNEVGN